MRHRKARHERRNNEAGVRGYRCDNCRDFQPEVVVPPDPHNFFTGSRMVIPQTWVSLVSSEGSALHFCSQVCVAAYVETLMRQEVDSA